MAACRSHIIRQRHGRRDLYSPKQMSIKQVFSACLLPCFTNIHCLAIDWQSYSHPRCVLTGNWRRSKVYLNKAARRWQTADVQHGMLMNVIIYFTLFFYLRKLIKNLWEYWRLRQLHVNNSVFFPLFLSLTPGNCHIK